MIAYKIGDGSFVPVTDLVTGEQVAAGTSLFLSFIWGTEHGAILRLLDLPGPWYVHLRHTADSHTISDISLARPMVPLLAPYIVQTYENRHQPCQAKCTYARAVHYTAIG